MILGNKWPVVAIFTAPFEEFFPQPLYFLFEYSDSVLIFSNSDFKCIIVSSNLFVLENLFLQDIDPALFILVSLDLAFESIGVLKLESELIVQTSYLLIHLFELDFVLGQNTATLL